MAHLVPFDIKPKRRRTNEQRKTISHFKYSRWKGQRRWRRAECEEEENHLVMSTRNKTNIKLKPTLHIGKLESIPWQAVRPPLTFSCAIFLDFICTVWRNYSHSSRKRKSFQHHFVVRIWWKSKWMRSDNGWVREFRQFSSNASFIRQFCFCME